MGSMRHKAWCGNSGFSLMEMLVAITITAVLSTAVIASFRVGISSWQRGGEFLDRSQRLSAAMELIQKQVGSITSAVLPSAMRPPVNPPARNFTETPGALTFVGGAREMVFVSDYLLSPLGSGGLQLVHYTVGWPEGSPSSVLPGAGGKGGPSGSTSGLVLRMTTTPIYRHGDFLKLAVTEDPSSARSVTLFEDIREIVFHYWGEEDAAAASASGDKIPRIVPFNEWDGSLRKAPPRAVAIQVRFGGATDRTSTSKRYNRDAVDLYIPINVSTTN
jgi:prepilin-type N-terminal cleavage/methylation domain-containing protein